MRCRPGIVPVCDCPGSAVHHERNPARRTNLDGFRALVLHRVRDTCASMYSANGVKPGAGFFGIMLYSTFSLG
jgi:hypothetical protein